MALLACGVCARRACCMCGHGRAPEYSRCRPHALVESCVDLGFCVHWARGSHVSGGQCVCGVPCVCRSLCACTVPVHRCVLRVWVCQWGERTGVGKCPGVQWVFYTCGGPLLSVGSRTPVGVGVCGAGAVPVWWGALCAHRPPGRAPPKARRRPQGLTCFTCLPQLVGKARSTAPRVGLARFLATSRNFRVTPTSGARVKGQA